MGILVTALTVLGLWYCFVHGSVLQEKITVLKDPNDDDWNVVIVTWKDEGSNDFQCQMFTDQKLIQEVLRTSGEGTIHRLTKEEMLEIEEECNSLSLKRKRRNIEEEDGDATLQEGPDGTRNTFGSFAIFPGTKWCGPGDIAKNDDDLGLHQDTDRCCRAHDHCEFYILPGETKHNLTNESSITKFNCKCDSEFFDCLSKINNSTSNAVGKSYFNIFRSPCYEKNYPLSKKCKTYKSMLNITCREYERDTTKPQEYQWAKAKPYKKRPTVTLPFDKTTLPFEKTTLPC